MDSSLDERIGLIHDVDMQHQSSLHQMELISLDEECRLVQLQVLALEDENCLLKDAISEKDSTIAMLSKPGDDIRLQMDLERMHSRSKDDRLKKETECLTNTKTEVEYLTTSMQKSSKLLQENRKLARELDQLRPEMKRLQMKLVNYDTLIAENQELRRQLSSLEVQLENDEYSKVVIDEAKPNSSSTKLAIVENKLANEQDRTSMKLALESKVVEIQNLNNGLEERISSLKLKLKSVQKDLRGSQAALETCRCHSSKPQPMMPQSQDHLEKQMASNAKYRNEQIAPEMSMDNVNPVEESDKPRLKRPVNNRMAEHILTSEKSTFSVTPFLNRNKSLADEAVEDFSYLASMSGRLPDLADNEKNSKLNSEKPFEPSPISNRVSRETQSAIRKPRGRPKLNPLSEALVLENNVASTARKTLTESKPIPHDSVEELDIKDPEINDASTSSSVKHSNIRVGERTGSRIKVKTMVPEVDKTRKKRKLFSGSQKTTFGDEDMEIIGKNPKTRKPSKQRLGIPSSRPVQTFQAGGAFSPLKRDRRGANATFLA